MKRIALAFSLVLCFVSTLHAQELKGKMELSVSGGAQILDYESDQSVIVNIPMRLGYFVSAGFELDVEGIITVQDDVFSSATETAVIVSANVSYNIPTNSPTRPFLLVGIGFTDGLPLVSTFLLPLDADASFTVLNAGAGLKAFATDRVAFRTEYRFQRLSGEVDTFYGPEDRTYTYHSLLFGISLFVL